MCKSSFGHFPCFTSSPFPVYSTVVCDFLSHIQIEVLNRQSAAPLAYGNCDFECQLSSALVVEPWALNACSSAVGILLITLAAIFGGFLNYSDCGALFRPDILHFYCFHRSSAVSAFCGFYCVLKSQLSAECFPVCFMDIISYLLGIVHLFG